MIELQVSVTTSVLRALGEAQEVQAPLLVTRMLLGQEQPVSDPLASSPAARTELEGQAVHWLLETK